MTSDTLSFGPLTQEEASCQVAIQKDPCGEELMPPAMKLSLEADPLVPIKLSDHYIPSWHLDWNLTKDPEPDHAAKLLLNTWPIESLR